MSTLKQQIEQLWQDSETIGTQIKTQEAFELVHSAVELLDNGQARVAEVAEDGQVIVHEWLKKAILLLFRVSKMQTIELGPFEFVDKLPLKSKYLEKGVRVVPGASARWGSFLEPGVIMMPSYVNIGARVGANTMVDTWATVGSCAQIGSNVHLSGGVGIGGVLEPPQASPVIIEDDVLIGSRCMVVEGARVGKGSVLAAGAILTKTIPVIDSETGEEISRGFIPAYSVAVGATRERKFSGGTFGLPCILVLRRLNEGERHDKAALNQILRSHGLAQ